MLYREIIAVCSEIHTKHINTFCGQNVEFMNELNGAYCCNNSIKQQREIFRPQYALVITGIVGRYSNLLWDERFEVRTPVKERNFLVTSSAHTCPVALPAPRAMDTRAVCRV